MSATDTSTKGIGMASNLSIVMLHFEVDNLDSVSSESANKLFQILVSDSTEYLIHLLLRNLAAETGVMSASSLVAYSLRRKHLI